MSTKTKKQRTIKAIETLISWYKKGNVEHLGEDKACPLCKIHLKKAHPLNSFGGLAGRQWDCRGCPQTTPTRSIFFKNHTTPGCCNSFSFTQPLDADAPSRLALALDMRIQHHEKLLEKVKAAPASWFTKKGWKPSI